MRTKTPDYTFTVDDFGGRRHGRRRQSRERQDRRRCRHRARRHAHALGYGDRVGGPAEDGAIADDLDELKYSPPANLYGTDVASFTFKVNGWHGRQQRQRLHDDHRREREVDDPVTGKPGITGTAQVGQTLTSDWRVPSRMWPRRCRTPSFRPRSPLQGPVDPAVERSHLRPTFRARRNETYDPGQPPTRARRPQGEGLVRGRRRHRRGPAHQPDAYPGRAARSWARTTPRCSVRRCPSAKSRRTPPRAWTSAPR